MVSAFSDADWLDVQMIEGQQVVLQCFWTGFCIRLDGKNDSLLLVFPDGGYLET
jgi:hypothetical protein